jgi:hypothetical protein
MGGFLSGLGELLGGFSAKKQIDETGFDWREKRAAEQFERDRRTQVAGQQDEDRAVNQIADVLATQEGEPDTSSIPGEVLGAQSKWRVQQALGKLPERKSSIAAANANARFAQEELRGKQRETEIGLRGDEAQELAQIQAQLRSNAPMTAFQRASLQQRAAALQAMVTRGTRRRVLKTPGQRNGVAGTVLYDQDTMDEVGFEAAPQTAATRGKEESKGAAMTAYNELMGVYDTFGGQPEGGLEARYGGLKRGAEALSGYNPEVRVYQAGVRGFVPLMARALGHVGVLTELDVERTEALFPTAGDTAAEANGKKRIIQEIMLGRRQPPFQVVTEDTQAGPSPRTPSPTMPLSTAGPGEIRTFGGQKYRLKPGGNPRLRSNWEVVP